MDRLSGTHNFAGGPTMLSWPDPLCAALACSGRHVAHYDLRDCGTSKRLRRDVASRSPMKRNSQSKGVLLTTPIRWAMSSGRGYGTSGGSISSASCNLPSTISAATARDSFVTSSTP